MEKHLTNVAIQVHGGAMEALFISSFPTCRSLELRLLWVLSLSPCRPFQQPILLRVSLQKRTESYDKEFGGKWGIRQLKLHLMALHGVSAVNTLFHEIQSLILRSLLSVQQVCGAQ